LAGEHNGCGAGGFRKGFEGWALYLLRIALRRRLIVSSLTALALAVAVRVLLLLLLLVAPAPAPAVVPLAGHGLVDRRR